MKNIALDNRALAPGEIELRKTLARRANRPRPRADHATFKIENTGPKILATIIDQIIAFFVGTLFHLLHARINTLHFPKPVAHRIHPVRAAIHNHPATAEFAIHAPVPIGIIRGILPSRPDGVPQSGFAERTTVKRPVNCALPNTATTLFRIRRDLLMAFGCIDNFLRGFNRYTNGFFAQNIHTAFEQFASEHMMQTVRTAYIGPIEIGL